MRKLFYITVLITVLSSCHNDPPMVIGSSRADNNLKENLINANRTIAQAEETTIDQYVSRRGWTMERLPEGARVWEYEKGAGKAVEFEDSVCVVYSVDAVNGRNIYEAVSECFVAGRRQQMIGLDQAVLRLHYGSKARVILPSALAYGIGGDGDRIPRSTILVLDLTVEDNRLEINN